MLRAHSSLSSLASITSLALVVLTSACDKKDNSATTSSQPMNPSTSTAKSDASDTPTTIAIEAGAGTGTTGAKEASAEAGAKKGEPVVTYKGVGLATPESVFHDDAKDVYLVSNINGQPLDVDNNGFISRLSPDGKVETLKWIEGGKNKVTLNAPKGLAVMGDNLYVADLDTVRIFDRNSGAPNGEVKIAGATFLNDIAVTSDGHVLVSDSALKASKTGFDPTGSDAVWSIDKQKKATPLAKSKDLGAPNGLLSLKDKTTDKTWVVTFGSGELYSLDEKGKKADAKKLPKGSLDGIVLLANGDLLVSSWEASTVYRGKPGGDFTPVIEDVKAPADLGYDLKRGRLLVPLFQSDEVRAYEIK